MSVLVLDTSLGRQTRRALAIDGGFHLPVSASDFGL
jgi:hypothetical protein